MKSLSPQELQTLYEKYLEIVHLEVQEFGCKATEVRHLLGRLGEFYCALEVNGTLSHTPNQHGFDVIAKDNRKISVKTTAQTSGFVTINPKTLDRVDDLMLLQYSNDQLQTIYYGPVSKAVEVSRTWEGKFELDISKARKITF